MPEGQGDFTPPKEPKEIATPVKLIELDHNNPEHVRRYGEIEAMLPAGEFETENQTPDEIRTEIEKTKSPVPFVWHDAVDDGDFNILGVGLAESPNEEKLMGFVSVYDAEHLEALRSQGFPLTELEGKRVVELAFGRHPEARIEQMAQGIKQTTEAVSSFFRGKEQPEGVIFVSEVKDIDDEAHQSEQEALILAGFKEKGIYDIRDEGEPEPDLWRVYALTPAAETP